MALDARKHRALSGISKQFCRSIQKHRVSEQKIISFYEAAMKTLQKFNLLCHITETLLRTVISFYVLYINTFVLFELFHCPAQIPAPSSPEKQGSSVFRQEQL